MAGGELRCSSSMPPARTSGGAPRRWCRVELPRRFSWAATGAMVEGARNGTEKGRRPRSLGANKGKGGGARRPARLADESNRERRAHGSVTRSLSLVTSSCCRRVRGSMGARRCVCSWRPRRAQRVCSAPLSAISRLDQTPPSDSDETDRFETASVDATRTKSKKGERRVCRKKEKEKEQQANQPSQG